MREDRYNATLKYLFGLEKFGMIFGLDNIRWLLEIIGNPQNLIKTVHIAGTNGKGSVAAMLSDILMREGYRVGKYTSPHLVSFTERIAANNEEINEREVVELTDYICEKVEGAENKKSFTFFDFTTALAFKFFDRKKVDIAVIETGLGGRFDSTNVILPLVSIITNVEYDHMEQLGPDIVSIAMEKAGIIKKGVPVVSGCEGVSKEVIENQSGQLGSSLYLLNRDFSFEKKADQVLDYSGIQEKLNDVFINLSGDHQLKNCAVVLCATEVLADFGFHVSGECRRAALSKVRWPGRIEKIHEDPIVLVDAAHNPHGIDALAGFIHTHFGDRRKILIFGVMKDKDYRKMLARITSEMDRTILTKPAIERALLPEEMQALVKDAVITRDVREAMKLARSIATKEDLILITGSFYTVGEAKTAFHEIF